MVVIAEEYETTKKKRNNKKCKTPLTDAGSREKNREKKALKDECASRAHPLNKPTHKKTRGRRKSGLPCNKQGEVDITSKKAEENALKRFGPHLRAALSGRGNSSKKKRRKPYNTTLHTVNRKTHKPHSPHPIWYGTSCLAEYHHSS